MPNDSQNDGTKLSNEKHRGNNAPPANAGTPHVSRRSFMQSAIAAATVVSMPLSNAQAPLKKTEPGQKPQPPFVPAQPMSLRINGRQYDLTLEPRVTLLDALREAIGLTGTKKGCDHGQCGACTVLVNGRRINSCLTLAIMNDGADITTIEGLAGAGDELHPLQAAFVDHDAFQCGYCTPGQICS